MNENETGNKQLALAMLAVPAAPAEANNSENILACVFAILAVPAALAVLPVGVVLVVLASRAGGRGRIGIAFVDGAVWKSGSRVTGGRSGMILGWPYRSWAGCLNIFGHER